MARYLLHHRHQPREWGIVFASFKGNASPLRHHVALASCRFGGHEIWWTVDAGSEGDAIRLMPFKPARESAPHGRKGFYGTCSSWPS